MRIPTTNVYVLNYSGMLVVGLALGMLSGCIYVAI